MIAEFVHASRYAQECSVWVVIMVPADQLDNALRSLAIIAAGHSFGGRTVVLGGGKLSVASAFDASFIPGDFDIMFVGWGQSDSNQSRSMDIWRASASNTITLP